MVISNTQIAERVSTLLQQNGHDVILASESKQAVSIFQTKHLDMVFTEVDTGDLDGWRFSRLVRSGVFKSDPNVPIILLTENHCERIAETTARNFDINRVISYQELDIIPDVVIQVKNGQGNLNQRQKILVVEDTQDTAYLVQRMLQHKYDIEIANDGLTAIHYCEQKQYDIILLDIMMPNMSGDEVLDKLMQINPEQTVIIMTAHGTVDLAELMLIKGAADYIQKPFKAEHLRKVCDIAAKREDYLIANQQFAAKTSALHGEQQKFDSLSKTHYRILDNLNSIVFELNNDGRLTYLNNAWFKCTGFTVSKSLGQRLTDFIFDGTDHTRQYITESITEMLNGRINENLIEMKCLTQDGYYFWGEVSLSPYLDENHNLIGVSGTIDDITMRKKAEERLKHVALHDTLTGMYNRYYFDNELLHLHNTAKRSGSKHALLYIDLDHFKVINDSQGHHQGDLVLKEIARLLEERTRASDVVCRIGGDEFSMLLSTTSEGEALQVSEMVCSTISDASFNFGDQTYKVSCSIGVTVIDGQSISTDSYLQQADLAMFAAKNKGRNQVRLFQQDDKLTNDLKYSFDWVQKLHNALAEDAIELHFQPIVDLTTGETEYYEALVRLIVDDKLIYPNDFIPALEKVEDMNLLDTHVIEKAFQLMSENPILKRVAINISAQAFADERLFSVISEKAQHYNVDPSRTIFELTESASLSNITGTQRIVNRLNDLGCQFSIDDFGTGFSTFAYLKQIPADSVKIDGSFVKDMLKDPTDAVLVKAINDTAHALNKKTVAEFVEDEATYLQLAELGVNYAQGYHIGKPQNITEILKQHAESAA